MPDLTVTSAGQVLRGWKAAEVTRSLDNIAGSFAITAARDGTLIRSTRDLRAFAPVAIALDGVPVLTGYVMALDWTRDAGTHDWRLQGRAITKDLTDCAALNRPGQWVGARIEEIAADLCTPFGIAVTVAGETGPPLPNFELEPQESAGDAIARAAQFGGLLLHDDGRGRLVIAAGASGPRAPIVLRETVESTIDRLQTGQAIRVALSLTAGERWSEVIVKGQRPGDDNFAGRAAQESIGRAVDGGVPRNRP